MAMINSISGSNNLKFDDVIGVILSREMRRKSIGQISANALIVENMGRQKERGKSPRNHGKYKKGISKSRGRLECWNCGKKGHLKKDCWSYKEKQGDGRQEKNYEANVTYDVL